MTVSTIFPNVYFLGLKAGEMAASLASSNKHITTHTLPTLSEALGFIAHFPAVYKEWWLNLVANDPVHVFVETTLLLSIVYILLTRSNDWKQAQSLGLQKDKLTHSEEQELVHEWKTNRAPLVPSDDHNDNNNNNNSNTNNNTPNDVVVHRQFGRWMEVQIAGSAELKKVLNFATFDFLGLAADQQNEPDKKNSNNSKNSMNEIATADDSNKNAALTTTTTAVTTDAAGAGVESNPVKDAARQALDKYGCGSCGPRGFYGTMDVHLQMEQAYATHLQTDSAIMYSDGASTCSSTIAAFCKRGDLLVVDEGIYEPLMTGVLLSRAHVKYFKHNDMDDLKSVLQKVQATDRQLGRKPAAQRRFIVVEGLYKNTGTVVPLQELVALKHEFSYRLILDESFSFGVLGKTGRGVVELYNKRLMHDVEIATIGLENSVGSIGGLTVGNHDVVDHQRLSGSGYCFSASTPPFAATAALKSLELLQTQPGILQRLGRNRAYMYSKLQEFCSKRLEDLLLVTSDERSPIFFLQVADIPETQDLDEAVFLREVVRESLARGVAVVATGQGATRGPARHEPPPGIRMTVSAAHAVADIDKALEVLGEAVDIVMSRFQEESSL